MSGFLQQHFLELLATIFGLLTIYYAARAHICNWFFGMIMVSLYFIIFFQVKLYADMSLQLIFFAFQFYGLYQWLCGGEKRSELQVHYAPNKVYGVAFSATLILYALIAYTLHHYTDSTTIAIDAFTTSLSLVAQWMMSKKWLEHWFLWMVVDVISIIMYINKDLYFTSGLYFIFLLLCIYGYFVWKKELQVVSIISDSRAETIKI